MREELTAGLGSITRRGCLPARRPRNLREQLLRRRVARVRTLPSQIRGISSGREMVPEDARPLRMRLVGRNVHRVTISRVHVGGIDSERDLVPGRRWLLGVRFHVGW
ncbi:MAG: hypothetical protein AB1646_24825 [Thermodesulfobacteriota bacterium]